MKKNNFDAELVFSRWKKVMIGRAAEIFAIFRVKSRDFQQKSGFFGFFKFENLMIDNCFHELLQKFIFFFKMGRPW